MSEIGYPIEGDARSAGEETVVDRRRLTVEFIQASAVAMDLGLVWATAVLSRFWWSDGLPSLGATVAAATPIGVSCAAFLLAFLGFRRSFTATHLSNPIHQLRAVAQGWAFSFFVIGWAAFLMKSSADFSRGATSIFFVTGFLSVALLHVSAARWLGTRFARGSLSLRRVAVVAVAEEGAIERIGRRLSLKGIETVSCSVIAPNELGAVTFPGGCRRVVGEVRTALASVRLDGIYLFLSWSDRRHYEELRAALGPMPVPVYLFADRDVEVLLDQPQVRIGGFRGFEVQRAPLDRVDRMLKRGLDLVVAGTAVVVLAPLMLLAALGILIESGRPVLFRQTRKGFGARPFEILKFRSMTVQENGDEVKQATRGDPRVTRLGRVLRKTSVDELPQLFNVLRGDMSIVGPRPHAMAHDDYYDTLIATYAYRQQVKPGITGWAQVNGYRGETRGVGLMSARVEHDLWYINNWSLWLDLKIILLTAIRVLADERAY